MWAHAPLPHTDGWHNSTSSFEPAAYFGNTAQQNPFCLPLACPFYLPFQSPFYPHSASANHQVVSSCHAITTWPAVYHAPFYYADSRGLPKEDLVDNYDGCGGIAQTSTRNIGTGLHQSHPPNRYNILTVDPASVALGEDLRTTLMVMNIPTKMTQEHFKEFMSDDFGDKVDFVYVPLDWKTGGAFGYAFVNLTDVADVLPFYKRFHGFSLPHSNSKKIWQVRYARVQGRIDLEAHFASRSPNEKIVPDFCGARKPIASAQQSGRISVAGQVSDSAGEPREPRRVRRDRARALKQ